MNEFKVGDKVIITRFEEIPSEYTGVYTVEFTEMVNNKQNKPNAYDLRAYVWIKVSTRFTSYQYVKKTNIRKLTKLERALK